MESSEQKVVRKTSENIEAVLVVISAFICSILIHSFIASLHLYLAELNREYPGNRELISVIIFLPGTVYGFIGLVSGMTIDKLGARRTMMIGSLEIIIGVGASSLAPNLPFLIVPLGILSGKGCSFVYFAQNVSLVTYFPNAGRQLVALVSIGEGICFLFALPMLSYFIESYDWRSSLLLLCGIEMHCIPFGLICTTKMKRSNQNMSDQSIRAAIRTSSFFENDPKLFTSQGNLTKSHQNNVKKDEKVMSFSTAETNKAFEDTESMDEMNYDVMSTSDDPGQLYMSHINESESSSTVDNVDQVQHNESKSKKKCEIDFSRMKRLLSNKMYVLTLITVFVFCSTSFTMLTILPDYCMLHGLSLSEGAWNSALSAFGDMAGRFLGSWLLHSKLFSTKIIFSSAVILVGIVIIFYVFVNKLSYIVAITFCFMFVNGLAYSQYAAIFLDLVDLNDYVLGMGFSETIIGLGLLICGYVVNLLTEYNDDNYDAGIIFLSVLTVSCVFPSLFHYIWNLRKTKGINLDHDQVTEAKQ